MLKQNRNNAMILSKCLIQLLGKSLIPMILIKCLNTKNIKYGQYHVRYLTYLVFDEVKQKAKAVIVKTKKR